MKSSHVNSTEISEREMFLTVTDMAELLKVSRYVIDRMLKNGELPAAKLGGQYRVRTDDFLKWWDHQVKQEQKNILRGCLPK
ncbi:MAG TPA: helix-turn-helix domain-containing protein [Candidatus Ventrousia excrementavium]|uniref:Helix-turn-helix domain-containing protein n=1 Tax=Candidatus Ventrousia excrementavium TaxID=2840961 RepID=A0A9D1LLL9_9CLOT|nr:helix-turn-helix domain-containing protein [Candidatus Ventrousia excrementavium]